MGQKVNPHGLRVGVIKDWDSHWYAREDKVGDLVVEDYNIRKYLKNKLYAAGIAKIEIERSTGKVKINIHCSRPGVIIGKGGMGDGTKAALQKYKQVYVQACPGCAVVLAAGIVGTKEPHWFEHGMPEAMWPLQAKHFGPFLVTMDSHGNSRYDKVRDYAQKVEKEILATK
mgnify:FL=1